MGTRHPFAEDAPLAGAGGRGPSGGISGLATWTPGVVQAESYGMQPELGGPGVCPETGPTPTQFPLCTFLGVGRPRGQGDRAGS